MAGSLKKSRQLLQGESLLYTLFKIGYDREGFDKYGFDMDGYDKRGFDKDGYDKHGFDKDGYDKHGFDKDGYDKDGFNERKSEFAVALRNYEANEKDSEADLAVCYLQGAGPRKDREKAFSLIVDGAFNNSPACLNLLGDCYYCGDIVPKNIVLAQFIYDLMEGKNPPAINQYKAMSPITFIGSTKKKNENTFLQEEKQLGITVSCIENDIAFLESKVSHVDAETWWMDRDQLENWRIEKFGNEEKQEEIQKLNRMKARPYYARMDSMSSDILETHYIGEEPYENAAASIVSVWSEYGRRYRAKNELEFEINGYKYKVTLKRRFDIANGKLRELFEDYNKDSNAAKAQITDPYLLRVLEEKKGETNITNIIRSIQLNQNNIIEYDFSKSLIVQGCAGSGKTMILLHRLANMKFNLPNLDLSRIKIITPNRQFNLFIDELSKNLRIDAIEKVTLNDYYLSLLGKYREENQELYYKNKEIKVNGAFIKQREAAWRETGPSEKDELRSISDDIALESDVVSIIYSNQFAKTITAEAKRLKDDHVDKRDYGIVMRCFHDAFSRALNEVNIDIDKVIRRNYTCVLYSKLLFVFAYYGKINQADSLLCIDEGQDISVLQYALIKRVNGDNVRFNIYGDLNQQSFGYSGIISWQRLSEIIEGKLFELNENYRNSDDIINFYNSKLGLDNKSFGLKTKPVETIAVKRLATEIKLQLLFKNRTAIITNNPTILPLEIKELCSAEIVAQKKAALLTVKQAKGLEFDSVFAFDNDLNKNERYIAYSRALSELYIVLNEGSN